jgi:predicted enzyme related to lactoylglutathione lyase
MFLGLRSHILDTADLDATKAWYSELLGHGPYFDEAFYVGFNVGGFELGLLPRRDPPYPSGGETYWGVSDIQDAVNRLQAHGAELANQITDVGERILMAVVIDTAGNRVGIIENPHFDPATAR